MPAQKKAPPPRQAAAKQPAAFRLTVEMDPVVDVIRKHFHGVTPTKVRNLRRDLANVLRFQEVNLQASKRKSAAPVPKSDDEVLSTQEAAELLGVSRPYLVRQIDSGNIPLHQQVGNQRRVLKSAVVAWHRADQARRRRALVQLGADLDNEVFSSKP
jgi:excisionase family DNA binding protein